jgi:hypothetical protein
VSLSTPRRRLLAALGAVGALLGAAACDKADEPKPPPFDVGLTVAVTRESGALRIDYTLVNRTGEPVVAFTGIPRRDTHENPVADPNAVYVTARDNDTVQIAKRVFAPPEGVGLAVDLVVRGTVLAPQASVAEVVRVPLPLTARHPYDTTAHLPESPKRAVFCVGVAKRDAVAPVPPASGDTDPRPVYAHRASVAGGQYLACGEPFDL